MSLSKFLHGLWSFFIGSLRMLLFLGATLLMFMTLVVSLLIISSTRDGMLDLLPRSGIQIKIYAVIISSLALSVLAAFGSFYSHHLSLKTFSALTVINSILIILLISTGSIRQENENYFSKLESYMQSYDWNSDEPLANTRLIAAKDEPLADKHEPTIIWNYLQRTHCCGLEGPKDWDKHRPSEVGAFLYPASCCRTKGPLGQSLPPNQRLCPDDAELFKNGCKLTIVSIEKLFFVFICFLMAYQLLLSILSLCVFVSRELDERRYQQPPHQQQHQLHPRMDSAGGLVYTNQYPNKDPPSPDNIAYPNLNYTQHYQQAYAAPRYGTC